MKVTIWLLIFVMTGNWVIAQPFKITIKTDNLGSSNSTSFTIPTTGGGYSYDVDWDDDGNFDDFGLTGNVTHDYGVAGTYTVAIQGTFPQIYFANTGDKLKLLSIDQWGSISWRSMFDAFYGCSNMTYNAVDSPDLSAAAGTGWMDGLSETFAFCSNFNGDLSGWDVSNVENMLATFAYSGFDGDISTWDVSSVVNMQSMFFGATSFNQDIGAWDVSSVTTMWSMFFQADKFNSDIGSWNVSSVTDMFGMFEGAVAFNQDISGWDMTNVTNTSNMFYGASSFNHDISSWNMTGVSNRTNMLRDANAFDQNIGSWDVNSFSQMNNMLDNSGMSRLNYDNTLIGWESQMENTGGIVLGAAGLTYCDGSTARDDLVNSSGWTISGDSEDCTPLPVELFFFRAETLDENKVKLIWATLSELNNDYFDIYRSADVKNFKKIARVYGKGTTNEMSKYQYIDQASEHQPIYYKLIQVDYDGTSANLGILSVQDEFSIDKNDISIFPNPVREGQQIQLLLKDKPSEFILEIYDLIGNQITCPLTIFDKAINIDTNELSHGYYILKIRVKSETKIFRIQKLN